MKNGDNIRYLRRGEIDTTSWDRCVRESTNGLLYARSFFLDTLGDWDALVTPEYRYILPLPKKKKFGLPYAYIPPFVGQLGIIGPEPVDAAGVETFLRHIPGSFKLVDILLNEGNAAPVGAGLHLTASLRSQLTAPPGLQLTARTNYVLPLQADYSTLYQQYSGDARKNLRRTRRAGLYAEQNISVEKVIELYRAAYQEKANFFSDRDYQQIAVLCESCIARGHGFTLGIKGPGNALHAAGFFGRDEKRIYYLLGAPGPDGRQFNAVHSLVDEVIRKYAGTALSFDFEGSDIPSVAAFYRKFSPLTRVYHQVKFHRLPRFLERFFGSPASSPR